MILPIKVIHDTYTPLERQGYSERIENMFGKGMINKDVGICFLHISRHLHF